MTKNQPIDYTFMFYPGISRLYIKSTTKSLFLECKISHYKDVDEFLTNLQKRICANPEFLKDFQKYDY